MLDRLGEAVLPRHQQADVDLQPPEVEPVIVALEGRPRCCRVLQGALETGEVAEAAAGAAAGDRGFHLGPRFLEAGERLVVGAHGVLIATLEVKDVGGGAQGARPC